MFIMKGLLWYLTGLAFFLLVFNTIAIGAQGLTAEELIDQKEKELTSFVAAVVENARNCDAPEGCSSSDGGCSRPACFLYGTKGDRRYQCVDNAAKYTVCGSQCIQRNFDFTRGFVRRVDKVNAHIARTVCTHRSLDNLFRKSSMNDSSHLFRVFFGAVDGTTRLYPGLDEDCNDDYDCRLRPWFIESTDVRKGVTLLVDSGSKMRALLPAANTTDDTYLAHAKSTALKVLKTLRDGSPDYVNIKCLNGDGTQPSNAKSVKYNESLYQGFSDTLDDVINSGSTKDPNATDFARAINEATSEMESTVPETYLKVIIVLTRGEQFEFSSLNLSPKAGVNLFVYNFPTTDKAPECNASIRVSSETIPVERMDNPLYALESYFSFLAKVHRNFMESQTDYGQKYADASGIDRYTLTVSKAAFGPNGELLGVVGIDFFETKVEEQYENLDFTLIVEAARRRGPTVTFDASKASLPSVCFNHTDACPSLQTTSMDGLCGEKGGGAKIGCCGKCTSKETPLGAILGGMAGGIVGLLGVATVVYCFRHRIARVLQRKTPAQNPEFSGSDDDPIR